MVAESADCTPLDQNGAISDPCKHEMILRVPQETENFLINEMATFLKDKFCSMEFSEKFTSDGYIMYLSGMYVTHQIYMHSVLFSSFSISYRNSHV